MSMGAAALVPTTGGQGSWPPNHHLYPHVEDLRSTAVAPRGSEPRYSLTPELGCSFFCLTSFEVACQHAYSNANDGLPDEP